MGKKDLRQRFGNQIAVPDCIFCPKMIFLCCLLVVPWLNAVTGRNPMENPGMFEGDMLGVELDADRNAIPNDNQRWPNGIVPYIVDKNLPEKHLRVLWQSMSYIAQRTCIKFVPWTDQADYIRALDGGGCYAHWGRLGIGEQQLSLGPGCDYLGTGIHEVLHALGFEHEHNRSDRDDFLHIYWENIYEGWDYAFKKLKDDENRLLTPFDYDSIMLYGSGSFAKEWGLKTMVAKNGKFLEEVYNKVDMTQSDIDRVNILYKCQQ